MGFLLLYKYSLLTHCVLTIKLSYYVSTQRRCSWKRGDKERIVLSHNLTDPAKVDRLEVTRWNTTSRTVLETKIGLFRMVPENDRP
jgi:hypothetical protein